jgi:hypothetical protein
MTSGQGGTGPEQGGQPPYGQPPYGSPPYGSPPYGPPPQYGQQPPYGYAPAPSATAGPPPEPKERPLAVRAGLGAFIAAIVFGVVGAVVSLLNFDSLMDQALTTVQDEQLQEAGVDADELAELGARIGIGIGIAITAVQLLFIWFAWKGRNWARIVLWVFAGLGLAFGLPGLLAQASPLPALTALNVFQLLALAVGSVLLATKPSSDWYRYEKWRRAVTGPRR